MKPNNARSIAILNSILFLASMSMSARAGLVAHYKFNDTLDDETGQHNGSSVATPAFDVGRSSPSEARFRSVWSRKRERL